MKKSLIILGPTASGKTALAVKVANKYNGEIISADSRQIYKGMDIGTGKDLEEYTIADKIIPYHLIDILEPKKNYSVFDFKKDFYDCYNRIIENNKLPILCGGTALYIDSILFDYNMPKSKPDKMLRKKLEIMDLEQLKNKLISIKKDAYDKNYHISQRRIIRTIEILTQNQSNDIDMNKQGENKFKNSLVLGIKVERNTLLNRIKERLEVRLNKGMIEEVENLLSKGISHERLYSLGLEYRYISAYLSEKINYKTMQSKLNTAINQFSKRQMTFFRRMEKREININWISINDSKNIYKIVDQYLK